MLERYLSYPDSFMDKNKAQGGGIFVLNSQSKILALFKNEDEYVFIRKLVGVI